MEKANSEYMISELSDLNNDYGFIHRLRTISTVMKKEFTLVLRYPTWFIHFLIWPFIFPLMYIFTALGFAGPDRSGLNIFSATAGTENYVAYIVIGTMTWMWVNTIMWVFGTFLRQEQMLGTLESNWLCPIKKVDFLIGAAMISIVQSFIICAVSILEYRFIYGVHFSGNVLTWILLFLIMLPAVYGLGSLFASLVLWAKEANSAVYFVRGLIMILCGITFPVTITPTWMQILAKGLPFTYGIAAARQLMVNGDTLSQALGNISICLAEGFVLLILGRLAFYYTERRVKNEGALGRF